MDDASMHIAYIGMIAQLTMYSLENIPHEDEDDLAMTETFHVMLRVWDDIVKVGEVSSL